MNRDRILLAIASLERIHAEALPFDIGCWFEDEEDPLDCGTAACALGWLCREPWAQKLGLTVSEDVPAMSSTSLGIGAARELFDMTHSQAVWLFDPGYYVELRDTTALDVAQRMSSLLEESS